MFAFSHATLAVLALSHLYGVSAATDTWFMDFADPIAREELDPIVSPNAESSHMHRIFGGSNFGASYNYDDYVSASCSTAPVQADKSAYWAPQLYYIDTDSSGNPEYIPLDATVRVYYNLGRNSANETVSPFPEGLRMLTGSPNNKSPDSSLTYQRFTCQGEALDFSDNLSADNFNFNSTCPNGMKGEIRFPPCWDGINLYKSDGSHVAFPAVGESFSGACPWTHPVRIPGIQFELTWHPERWSATGVMAGHLIWANGDTTSYGFHADFVNGWETDVLSAALVSSDCVGGQFSAPINMASCPVLAASYDNNAASACTPAKGVLQEPLGQADNVPVSALPGCNLPWGATGSKPTCSSTVKLDVSAFTGTDGALVLPSSEWENVTLPTDPGWAYLGCSQGNTIFNDQYSYYDTSLTPERCQATCLQSGLAYSAVAPIPSYACFCGSSLLNSTAFTDGCTSTCPGNSSEICGGSSRSSVYYAPPGTDSSRADPSSLGCYAAPTPVSAGLQGLTDYSFTSSSMTTELCEQSCANRGSTFAFTMNNYCYCGASGTAYSRGNGYYKPDDFCTYSCPGNSTESCGGGGLYSVYNLTASSITAVNVTASKPAGWQGCYISSGTTGVASLTSLQWQDSSAMTPQACVNGCSEYGYSLAALQLGNRCNCGNTWNGGSILPASQCSLPCTGNSSLTCGAQSYQELYTTAYATDTMASVAATKPAGYLACYYTPSSTDGYNNYSFTSTSMTVETCVAGCAEMGYAFGAPQSGNKCKCSSVNTTAAAWPHTYCNTACKGNSSETCGGSFYSEGYDIGKHNSSASSAASGLVGCYSDTGTGGGAPYSYTSSSMTIELCESGCKQANYSLAILGNGKTCYCSNSWGGGQALPSSQCTSTCSGNSSETCGGGTSAASVYQSSFGADAPAHNISGWLGCYTNPSSARVISSYTYSSSYMTPELCQANCASRGYSLAGVWQGNQCSCGNSTTSATVPAVLECATACYGDSTNSCGSSTAMDLYNATTTTSATSTTLGCYSDVSTLGTYLYSADYMDNAICAAACATAGYSFAGTYASTVCRCGNTQPQTLAADARCSSTCAGVPTEICGGPSAVTVTKATSSAVVLGNSSTLAGVSAYYGCYHLGSTKMLSATYYSSTSMTNAQCVSNCKGLGYTWAGTYNAKYCYCDNAMNMTTGNYRILDTDCNSNCTGNSAETCGSSGALNLFNTAESTTAALTGSSVEEGMLGCYAAGTQATAAPYIYKGTISASVCRRTCRVKGYTLAAVYNGLECTCSNDYSLLGAVQPLSECSTPCNGNTTEICGYGSGFSVYDTTGAGSLPPTTGYPTGYVGCFADSDITAKSSYHVSASTMSITSCASICAAKGTSIYGVDNGNTCWCATSMPASEVLDSLCTTTCPGISSQTCGASGKLSMYYPSLVASWTGTSTAASTNSTISVSAAASTSSSKATSSSAIANSTSIAASATANVTSTASASTSATDSASKNLTASNTLISAASTTLSISSSAKATSSNASTIAATSSVLNTSTASADPSTSATSNTSATALVTSTRGSTSSSAAASSSETATISAAAALASDKTSAVSSSGAVVPVLTASPTTTVTVTATAPDSTSVSSVTLSSASSSRNATSSSSNLSSSWTSACGGGATVTITDTVTQTVTDTVTGTASASSGSRRKRHRQVVKVRRPVVTRAAW